MEQILPDDVLHLIIDQLLNESERPQRCAAIVGRVNKCFLIPARRFLYSSYGADVPFTSHVMGCMRKESLERPHLAELVRNVILNITRNIEEGDSGEAEVREVLAACRFSQSVVVRSVGPLEQVVRIIAEENAGSYITSLVLMHSPETYTPAQEFDYTPLSSLPNLVHLSLHHLLLVTLPPAYQSTLTSLALEQCNAISFSPLIESSPLLTHLKLVDSEFNGVPRALPTKHDNLRQLTIDNSTNIDNLATKIFLEELSEFVGSFPRLNSIRLGIPHWDETEEAEWNGAVPLPNTLKSIAFTGPTSPFSALFVEELATNRWPALEELKFGAGVGKTGEMQNCCSMSEDEIWNLESAVRERGGIYLSINEGRVDVEKGSEMTVRNRSDDTLFCHLLICDPKEAESFFDPCILDDERGSSD